LAFEQIPCRVLSLVFGYAYDCVLSCAASWITLPVQSHGMRYDFRDNCVGL